MTVAERIRKATLEHKSFDRETCQILRMFIEPSEWPAMSHETETIAYMHALFVAEAIEGATS
jgi:hypothetical protein